MRLAALVGALLLGASSACAETLVASLSTSRVLISSNYTGSSVVVFGTIERDAQTVSRAGGYDVVVTVRGPKQTLVVREKKPVGPIWVNRAEQTFEEMPAYLAVLSSAPLETITTEPLRRRLRVGLDAVVDPRGSPANAMPRDDHRFREALLRIEQRAGLYSLEERGVSFLTRTVFRAPIPVPATAPPGNYDVEIALFADHALLSRAHTSFELVKTGFEQRVADLARHWSAAYGVATAGVALLFGWLASVIFRRD
jgi:uncharacterized protein (TIGR02186 family)